MYGGVPFAEYEAWPYVNNSSLGPAVRSGKHYELSLQAEPRKASAEMDFGSLVHCLVLESDKLHDRFAVEPDFTDQLLYQYRAPHLSAEYQALKKRWTKDHRDKIIVTQDCLERATRCGAAVRNEIGDWLALGNAIGADLPYGAVEVSVVSDCPETKLRLKSRVDLLLPDKIVDVKTTRDAHEFEDEIARYNYHRQGAFYQDVLEPHVGQLLPVWLVAVETSEPWLVRVAPLDESAIEEGRREMTVALRRIAAAQQSQADGYPRKFKWRLPKDRHVVDVVVAGQHIEIGR